MSRYRRLLPYALRQWPLLLGIFGLTIGSSLLVALQPWPLKVLVDYALGTTPSPELLTDALSRLGWATTPAVLIVCAGVASLAVFALNSFLEVGLTWGWALAGRRMVRDLACDVFNRLQRLSFRYHQQHAVGDSLDRLTSDTWCVYTMTDGILISPVQKVITLGALGAVAWQLNAELAAYSLLTAPLMAWATLRFGNPLKQRARIGREARARLVSFVHQTLSSIPVVQTFATENRNWDRFHDLAADSVSISERSALLTSYYGLVTGLITVAGTAVIIYVGGRQVLAGALSVGSFLVFLAYLRNLQSTAEGLLRLYGILKPLEASIDRVIEVLQARDDEVCDRPDATPLPSPGKRSEGHVRFEDVTFGYEPGRPVLQRVSLVAEPGETVALVGATGAGKTTLASLIPRFYDPWSGRITFNNQDLREVRLADLRSQIAYVFQEPFLLPLSAADNIAYGRPSATREEIISAARAANADRFIQQLPQGYDTLIGERGATLSGGERQRLAIARAMLKDAPVLILDEPTSALDADTEALILEALEQLMKGRTTFIIAHRLSTVRHANRILVLENGQIVEAGTHHELLDRAGTYAHYVRLQNRPSTSAEVAA
jgi:ATP-binding cassette subfamily B protein/subfamily B ATP-binding cassette protein MsbA